MSDILLISPTKGHIGGTGLLFSRVCEGLVRRHGHRLHVVDFKDGAVARHLAAAEIPFTHVVHDESFPWIEGEYDHILTNLLSAKPMQARMRGSENARLFLWMTYTADAYKWLPLSTLLNGMPLWWRRMIAWIHRGQSRRIGDTLTHGMQQHGIAMMDEECMRYSSELFPVRCEANIIPICSGPSAGQILREPRTRRPDVVWVGRLTDFKTAALMNVLGAFAEHASSCPLGRIHIVGDGSDRRKLEGAAKKLEGKLEVHFHGHLPPDRMSALLQDKADIFIGHGTSLLEAAQLGIPSLLVDPSYAHVPPFRFRADWFVDQAHGNVGRLIQEADDYQGRSWPDLYAEYARDPVGLGRRCRRHWETMHDPNRITDMVNDQLARCTYTLRRFRADGGPVPGPGGRLIEAIKSAYKALRR